MIYSRSNTLESNVYKKSFVDYKTGIKPEEEEEEEGSTGKECISVYSLSKTFKHLLKCLR